MKEFVVILTEDEIKNLVAFLNRVPLNPNGNQASVEAVEFVRILEKIQSAEELNKFLKDNVKAGGKK